MLPISMKSVSAPSSSAMPELRSADRLANAAQPHEHETARRSAGPVALDRETGVGENGVPPVPASARDRPLFCAVPGVALRGSALTRLRRKRFAPFSSSIGSDPETAYPTFERRISASGSALRAIAAGPGSRFALSSLMAKRAALSPSTRPIAPVTMAFSIRLPGTDRPSPSAPPPPCRRTPSNSAPRSPTFVPPGTSYIRATVSPLARCSSIRSRDRSRTSLKLGHAECGVAGSASIAAASMPIPFDRLATNMRASLTYSRDDAFIG